MLYTVCKRMITNGNAEGLEAKLDIFFAANKLTEKEYNELIKLLHKKA